MILTKIALRQQFKAQRTQLNSADLQEKSQAISHRFFEFFNLSTIRYLHLFLPISRFNEIDTWIIANTVWNNYPHITLVTAKSDLKTTEMTHHIFDAKTKIVKNAWGIPEPVNTLPCPEKMLDMILLPLLCFDKQGARVGYGKGFYDKFLQKCRTDTLKVGLSLFEPVDKIVDTMLYDINMNFCVTTKNVCVF